MARRSRSNNKIKSKKEEEMSTSSSEHQNLENESEDEQVSDANGSSTDGSDDNDESADGGGDDDESADDASSDEQEGSGDDNDETSPDNVTPEVDDPTKEQCTFSLPDLISFNTHQLNPNELYSTKSSSTLEWYRSSCCIESQIQVNEDVLMEKAIGGTSQLLRELWKLPSDKVDGGFVVAKLPQRGGSGGVVLPRALPPPPQKQLSKWEKFALERGISPKSKRSRKQFDEATGTWKHLTGSLQNKANAGPESWPILEVKKNDDPDQDPWEKLREEKKKRVDKNTQNRMKNAEHSGLLEKGGANRMAKNLKRMEKQRQLSRENERQNGLIAPAGVPIDMMKSPSKQNGTTKRGKPNIQLALQATQVSTASLGKFDKMREGEPERKLDAFTVKKRKLLLSDGSNSKKKSGSTEEQKSRDILSKVMNGSKEKEKDVRKGKYARGETAYDYEFDDGLGAGTFKKKKGRAGVGKMRKITKKRIK